MITMGICTYKKDLLQASLLGSIPLLKVKSGMKISAMHKIEVKDEIS